MKWLLFSLWNESFTQECSVQNSDPSFFMGAFEALVLKNRAVYSPTHLFRSKCYRDKLLLVIWCCPTTHPLQSPQVVLPHCVMGFHLFLALVVHATPLHFDIPRLQRSLVLITGQCDIAKVKVHKMHIRRSLTHLHCSICPAFTCLVLLLFVSNKMELVRMALSIHVFALFQFKSQVFN